jgi:predicted nucleic acid-binding protein
LKAVADASSLIHPAKIPRFWRLMKQTFDEILIPEAVYQEILQGKEIGSPDVPVVEEEVTKGWIKVRKVKARLRLPENLGRGEKEATSLMRESDTDWLLIDDRVASTAARLIGVKTRSTAYLLIYWTRKGVIAPDEALELLDSLVGVGYHLSLRDYLSIKKRITAPTET